MVDHFHILKRLNKQRAQDQLCGIAKPREMNKKVIKQVQLHTPVYMNIYPLAMANEMMTIYI